MMAKKLSLKLVKARRVLALITLSLFRTRI
jgi:hypothetical protein